MVVTTKLQGGAVVIPDELRAALGWKDGVEILAVAEDGELRLLASDLPTPEIYSPERRAEFLLNSAVSAEDYQWAIEETRRLGLDPDTIPHERPEKWAT
jgi:bifunctional DNA-binding transcriptional regulator/antitoxin component of YhaV-PrlF toxin-antitoxin module